MKSSNFYRLRIISFDFKQPAQSNQARKTRFFRSLYGYTQNVKRRSRNGQIVEYSYHYPGLLDYLPHIKLGKSVFGVKPGHEFSILELLDEFQEITYHQFIGWIDVPEWPEANYQSYLRISQLIHYFGFLSILIVLAQYDQAISKSSLLELGFEGKYVDLATEFLKEGDLLDYNDDMFILTSKGSLVAKPLLENIDR